MMARRTFLKTSLAAGAFAASGCASSASSSTGAAA